MKSILLSLIICLAYTGYSQKETMKKSAISTSKTIIELEDAKTIFKEKKADFWDKYSSGLIAGITVLASLGISIWQAWNSHRQTKANSISAARIQWIQELRPNLSELITNASSLSSILKQIETLFTESEGKDFTNLQQERFDKLNDDYKVINTQLRLSFNKVKLFLNRNEEEHRDLIESIQVFIKDARKRLTRENKNEVKESHLIEKAQIVLKNAWEQAKV